jgi:hypothetical protein
MNMSGVKHADALREVLAMVEHSAFLFPEHGDALRWAVGMAERPTLSTFGVQALFKIVDASRNERGVRRLVDGYVVDGTARHLVVDADDFRFPREDTDVRDTYLRVTLPAGGDTAWLVADLISETASGDFHVRG